MFGRDHGLRGRFVKVTTGRYPFYHHNGVRLRMCTIDLLHTTRLIGYRLEPEHFKLLYTLYQDPLVTAKLGGARSDEEINTTCNDNLTHWDQHGFGFWVFYAQDSLDFIGRAGLRRVDIEGNSEIEIAYSLISSYWGRGLATEMAGAIVDVALNRLNLREIVAFTQPDNYASIRVMEKIGFIYERDFVHAGLPHVLYRM